MNIVRESEWDARLPRIASNHPTHDEDNNPYNVFESMTYGLTFLGDNQPLLTCHIDQFNDRINGMNVLMCVYFNFFPQEERTFDSNQPTINSPNTSSEEPSRRAISKLLRCFFHRSLIF